MSIQIPRLQDNHYISVFYHDFQMGEKIINNYLPNQEPDKDENINLSPNYRIQKLIYGADLYYKLNPVYNYKSFLVHNNNEEIEEYIDQITYTLGVAVAVFFEDGNSDLEVYDNDWCFIGTAKGKIDNPNQKVSLEIGGKKFEVNVEIHDKENGIREVYVWVGEIMEILLKLIDESFEFDKEIILNY